MVTFSQLQLVSRAILSTNIVHKFSFTFTFGIGDWLDRSRETSTVIKTLAFGTITVFVSATIIKLLGTFNSFIVA